MRAVTCLLWIFAYFFVGQALIAQTLPEKKKHGVNFPTNIVKDNAHSDTESELEEVTKELESIKKALDELPPEFTRRFSSAQLALGKQISESIATARSQEASLRKLNELIVETKSIEEALGKEKQKMDEYVRKIQEIRLRYRIIYLFTWAIPGLFALFFFHRAFRNSNSGNKLVRYLQDMTLAKIGRSPPFKGNDNYAHARLIAWHIQELKGHLGALGEGHSMFSPQKQERFRNDHLLLLTNRTVGILGKIWDTWGIAPINPMESAISAIGIKLKELEQRKSRYAKEVNFREQELSSRLAVIESEISSKVKEQTELARAKFVEDFLKEQEDSIRELNTLRASLQSEEETLRIRSCELDTQRELLATREEEVNSVLSHAEESKRMAEELIGHNQLILDEVSDQKIQISEAAKWQDESAIRLNNAIKSSADQLANLIFDEPPAVVAQILEKAVGRLQADKHFKDESA